MKSKSFFAPVAILALIVLINANLTVSIPQNNPITPISPAPPVTTPPAGTPPPVTTPPVGTQPPVTTPPAVIPPPVTTPPATNNNTFPSIPPVTDVTAIPTINTNTTTTSNNTFSPNIVNAHPGDVILWNWKNGNHSLLESTMSDLCSKKVTGISVGPYGPPYTYSYTVQNKTPVLFYCGAKDHCQSGEKILINGPAGFSWDDTTTYTTKIVISTAPPSSNYLSSAGIQHPSAGQRMLSFALAALFSTVACTKCQKTTWAGCGRHIQAALKGVAEEDLCHCKKTNSSSKVAATKEAQTSNNQQAKQESSFNSQPTVQLKI
ncbi:7471_t:CDS:2 [Ambispora leptoticha]|uniref:7471_t:CDS:1 n=1 Tax=Ambispora leptoticha TaxID=144679 RepID=A0A9N9E6A8_9GLOM|nr:7471_t:CDS:2 [Ambispora leptoticha]